MQNQAHTPSRERECTQGNDVRWRWRKRESVIEGDGEIVREIVGAIVRGSVGEGEPVVGWRETEMDRYRGIEAMYTTF